MPAEEPSPASARPALRPSWRSAAALLDGWPYLVGAFLIAFASLPVLAPILAWAGDEGPADLIVRRYALVCHQLPSRSFFILGHQMAYCERNTALYGSMALGALIWARWGHRLPRLSLPVLLLLALPMALDGFTQLAGLRESTWQLRVLTGTLAGAGGILYALPILQDYLRLFRLLLPASLGSRQPSVHNQWSG